MALDDFLESEVGVAVAAAAVLLSPPARALLRRGAVFGLASLLRATETISSAAGSIAQEAQHGPVGDDNELEDITDRTRSSTQSTSPVNDQEG